LAVLSSRVKQDQSARRLDAPRAPPHINGASSNPRIASWTELKTLLSSRRFETFITALIVINAITLGLETVPEVMERFGVVLTVLDRAILACSS
jgi:hypothetical protein